MASLKTEETYWLRVCHLLTSAGKDLLLCFFRQEMTSKTLNAFMASNKHKIVELRDKGLIKEQQFHLLNPPNTAKWDITLISTLIFHFIYMNKQQKKSVSNIRRLRNDLYGHIGAMALNESEYNSYWPRVQKVLKDSAKALLLNSQQFNIQPLIKKIQNEKMFAGDVLKELLECWKNSDVDLFDKVEQLNEAVKEGLTTLTDTVKDSQASLTETVKDSQASLTDTVKDSQASLTETVKDSQASLTETVKDIQTTMTKTVKDSQASLTETVKDIQTTMTKTVKDSQASLTETVKDGQASLTETVKDIQTTMTKTVKDSQASLTETVKDGQASLTETVKYTQTSLTETVKDSQTSLTKTVNDSQTSLTETVKDSQASLTETVKDSQASLTETVKDSQASLTETVKDSQASLTKTVKDSQASLTETVKDSQASLSETVKDSQISLLEVVKQGQTAMTEKVKDSQLYLTEVFKQSQTEFKHDLSKMFTNQGVSLTGSLPKDMELTPGCSTSMPDILKKTEVNSSSLDKSTKQAVQDCSPYSKSVTPGTSKSPAEEGLDAFPNLKLFQRDLIECYKTGIVKAPATILGTRCHTDISDIYAEPDMVKEDHRALTSMPIANKTKNRKTKRISYEEIFTEGQNRKIYVCGDAGVGKTSFCKSLVSAWCSAHDEGNIVSSCGDSEDQQKRQSAMKKFKIVFYISLRRLPKTDTWTIKDMTLSQLLKDNPFLMPNRYGMNTSEEVLEKILLQHSEECLFILDGLDELTAPCTSTYPTSSDGIPGTPYHKYTVLITSRTWKLESLRLMDIEIDLKIMLQGVKSGEEFGSKLVKHFNNSNPVKKSKKYQDFEEKMKVFSTRLNDLESVPIFFKHLICLWYSDEDLGKSVTETCMNMVELLFKLGEERENVKQFEICANRQCKFIQGLPFKRLIRCERYEPLLLSLGKLAFETIFQQDQAVLVFEEDDLSSYDISSQDIDTSLKVGILSLNSVPSMTSHKRKISFLHRSFHELFAAMFLASNGDRGSVDRFFSKCQTLDHLYEIKDMLIFLSGMSPSSVSRIAKHLVTVVNNDSGVMLERSSLLIGETVLLQRIYFVQYLFLKICFECIQHDKLTLPLPDINLMGKVAESKDLRSRLSECLNEFPSELISFTSIGSPLDVLTEFGTIKRSHYLVSLDMSKHVNLKMFRCLNNKRVPVVLSLNIDAKQLVVLTLTYVSLPELNSIIRTATNLNTLEFVNVKFCDHTHKQRCTCLLDIDLTYNQKVEILKVTDMSLTSLALNDDINTLTLISVSLPHEHMKKLTETLSNTRRLTSLQLTHVFCKECSSRYCTFNLNISDHTSCHTVILRHMFLGAVMLSRSTSSIILQENEMIHSDLCSLLNFLEEQVCLEVLFIGIKCKTHGSMCDAKLDLSNQTKLALCLYDDSKSLDKPIVSLDTEIHKVKHKLNGSEDLFFEELWNMTSNIDCDWLSIKGLIRHFR